MDTANTPIILKTLELKQLTGKDFFRSSYRTDQLYTAEDVAVMLRKIDNSKANGGLPKIDYKHYESPDGIMFYSNTFREGGKEMTTLTELKNFSCMSGSHMWRFGYVTEKGEIFVFVRAETDKDGYRQMERIMAFRTHQAFMNYGVADHLGPGQYFADKA